MPESGPIPPAAATAGRQRRRLVVGIVLLLAIAVAFTLIPDTASLWQVLRTRLDGWQNWTRENPMLAAVLFFLLFVGVTALSLPVAAPMSLVAGALFGRWLGTGIVSVAATLGATGAFLASRYLFRDWVRGRLSDRLKRIDVGVERDGAYYLLSLRLVPLFPFWMINLAMGLTTMRVLPYMLVSWIGMLPGTFLYVNAGTEIGRVESPADVLSPGIIVSFLLLALVPITFKLLLRRFGSKSRSGPS
jgi:uncharacterized membrane protein YdjX (TVP38/TMEM64 family)